MGQINDTADALATYLTTAGVMTYAWEESSLQQRAPVATLFLDEPIVGQGQRDQNWRWGSVKWILRYYISTKQSEKQAQYDMRDAIENIATLIGADPTLGRRVICTTVNSVRHGYDPVDSLLYTEWSLEVIPFP